MFNISTFNRLQINGGMGLISLQIQNEALLIKWLWRLEKDPTGLWGSTIRELYGISETRQIAESPHASFFLRGLQPLATIFKTSSYLDPSNDALIWRWTTDGLYPCSSTYKFMHNGGVQSAYNQSVWKFRVPMKVRIFLWLLFRNQILTQEVLVKRGCMVDEGCCFCNNNGIETRQHLFWECTYANSFWRGLAAELNLPPMSGTTLINVWIRGRKGLTKQDRLRWDTAWAAGTWTLWKERNRRILGQEMRVVGVSIGLASKEAHNWLLFC